MLLRVARRRRAAVVAVGDVGDGDAREELLEFVGRARRAGRDLPDRVADAVGRDKVVQGLAATRIGDNEVYRLDRKSGV